MEDRRQRRRMNPRPALLAELAIGISTVLVIGVIVVQQVANTGALIEIGIGAAAAAYCAATVIVVRRVLRTRYFDFRLALTGEPKAGKTVFANLLYDQLMNGNDLEYEFTAESKSAIATYQAIRGIAQDEWPPSTSQSAVFLRDGVLRHRRVVVDLEIGDSAGQYWLALSGDSVETDYLQWVLSAHAIVHVVPADRLIAGGIAAAVRRDVEDLRLAAQLMRNVSKTRYTPRPMLVVISKMDLVLPMLPVAAELLRTFSAAEARDMETTAMLSEKARADVGELFRSLSDELEGEFRTVEFMYSSVEVLTGLRTLGGRRPIDVAAWIVRSARA